MIPDLREPRGHRSSEIARRRLLATPGEPLVVLEWQRVFFLHFEIDAEQIRKTVPPPYELDLFEGRAIVSLVALTKRRFRPNPAAPAWARVFRVMPEQRFFNLRTYVRHRDDPGAFFFWSWLSRPWGLPLPARPMGLTCSFARSEYLKDSEKGTLGVIVAGKSKEGRFACRAEVPDRAHMSLCTSGSLSEFAMERYTGYFVHLGRGRVFRAWHPVWRQISVKAGIEDRTLVVRAFPWFRECRFMAANYSRGFGEVWIGRPHRIDARKPTDVNHHHGPSALFHLP